MRVINFDDHIAQRLDRASLTWQRQRLRWLTLILGILTALAIALGRVTSIGMEPALILGGMFLAGIVQGTTGFGFGLVAITFLSTVVGIKDASVLLVLSSLALNIIIFKRCRASFAWQGITPMLICAVLCVPVGIFCLVKDMNRIVIE